MKVSDRFAPIKLHIQSEMGKPLNRPYRQENSNSLVQKQTLIFDVIADSPLMSLFAYRLPFVGSGQSSVLNGVAGNPAAFTRFGCRGLLLKAYRTANVLDIFVDQTSTL